MSSDLSVTKLTKGTNLDRVLYEVEAYIFLLKLSSAFIVFEIYLYKIMSQVQSIL